MQVRPVLVNPVVLHGMRDNSPVQIRTWLMGELGTLELADVERARLKSIEAGLVPYPILADAWRVAIAEELLVLRGEGCAVDAATVRRFADVSLFGWTTLEDCWDKHCAVGVFPLAGDQSAPGIGHAWVVEGLADGKWNAAGLPEGFGLGILARQPFVGDSWQLAAGLAAKAAVGGKEDRSARRMLARDWIATGRLIGEEVGRVELGNKLDIDFRGRRHWLVPPANAVDTQGARVGTRIEFPHFLDSAWAIVSGMGTQRGDASNRSWPENVVALHVLVGGQIQAAIASILYTPPSVPVVLWRSDSSLLQADEIIEIVGQLRPGTKMEKKFLSSSDLVEAEQALWGYFQARPPERDSIVLFNVTSGNRLMSYAVQGVANRRLNMRLIYRDPDAEAHEFTLLDYGKRPVSALKVEGSEPSRHPLTEDSWKWLFKRSPRVESKEQVVGEYLKNLDKAESRP
jgi:hypothetical protein